jgi:hypothetical protein
MSFVRLKSLTRIVAVIGLMACLTPLETRAQLATPEATDLDFTGEILIDVPLGDLPSPPALIGIARLLFPGGSTILGGAEAGPRLFLVESGSFLIWLDSGGMVYRGGNQNAPVAISDGQIVRLQGEDLLVVADRPPFEVTNDRQEPSTLIDIVVWPAITQRIRPFVTETGVLFEPLVTGRVQQLPDSPARLVLRRFSLPVDGAVGFAMERGPQLLYVESGILGALAGQGTVNYSSAATQTPGSIAGQLKTLSVGSEARLTAGGSVVAQIGSTGAIRNLGRTKLDLLSLSVSNQSV